MVLVLCCHAIYQLDKLNELRKVIFLTFGGQWQHAIILDGMFAPPQTTG